MSDSKVLEEQISEIKSELTQANETIEELKAEAAKAEALSSDIETLQASVKEKEEIIASLEEKVSASETQVSELTASLEVSETELAANKSEMYDMKKKQKEEKRKAALVEAGMESSDAEANLASFEALDDEAFDSVVSLYAAKSAAVAEEATSTEEADEAQASEETEEAIETPEEVFEDVVSEDATLVVAEKDEAAEAMSARAELSDWISDGLNK